jgi:PKD repeat protein
MNCSCLPQKFGAYVASRDTLTTALKGHPQQFSRRVGIVTYGRRPHGKRSSIAARRAAATAPESPDGITASWRDTIAGSHIRQHLVCWCLCLLLALALAPLRAAGGDSTKVHTTYIWHMHQPIYWPKSTSGSGNGYEKAKDTMDNAGARGNHPSETLADIFGVDDRKAGYQYRMKDAVGGMGQANESGAQCTMSGSLMQNVKQLGDNNWNGYSSGWTANGQARTWKTPGNKPRLDFICIPAHHPIAAFADPRTLELEIRIHKYLVEQNYGTSEPYTKGFFPPEMCFSQRIIPTLVKEGFNWVAIANNHLSRACPNFPYVHGSGGELCDPPNKADQLNPPGANWYRESIDRGCAPCNAMPFSVQPHYARQYDPHSGQEYKIIVVPAEMALSWKDGYASMGAGPIVDNIAPYNDSAKPSLVLLCHDGDNAWGGGYSYYHEAVPNLTGDTRVRPTTVEQHLLDHPVSASDIVHVEDGGWVNADGDFGSPFMLNWTWFLWKNGKVDIETGWHYKLRDYAIRMAALNFVLDAEATVGAGSINAARVAEPYTSGASAAEKAWHFYLGSLDSGFQYYGNPGDNEIRVTIACNEAYDWASTALGSNPDRVGPTVWIPQRYPWNPGGLSFGPQNYGQYGTWGPVAMGKDFYVWTLAYDRSGISGIKVLYRTDKDGVNSMAGNHNELFAGGSEVNAWQEQPMTDRGEFPKTMSGFDGLENINYELPSVIAHHYWTKITGVTNTLYDYAIVAVDALGQATTSDIQHVYVGPTSSGGGGDDSVVTFTPDPPVRGANCTISYNAAGRNLAGANPVKLHLGFNNWSPVISPDPAMTGTVGGVWAYTTFISSQWTQIDCVFNNGAGTWDNNSGQDWHQTTVAGDQPPGAAFSGIPRSGDAPLTVYFTDTSSGSVTWRQWSFGDGGTSGAQNPSNVYAAAGTYSVTLIVSNAFGVATNTQADYITVTTPGAPQANFSATPLYGPPGTVVQFTDQSGGTVTGRVWSFGDGGTSGAQHPSHAYAAPGVYDVQLIAGGPAGVSTNRKTGYITIAAEYVSNIDGTNLLTDFTGAARVLQDTPTGFGDATTPGTGSELDALYVTNSAAALLVGIAGNIELNGNCMMLFVDSRPGGINAFSNSMSFTSPKLPNMAGVTFDAGFAPDFAVIPNTYGGGHYVDFEQLDGAGKDGYYGTGTGDLNVSRVLVNQNTGFRYGLNNSNVGGVTASSTNGAGSVSTGWEIELPFELLDIVGPTAGSVRVQAIITSSMGSSSKWISNQSLPGIGNTAGIQGQLSSGAPGGDSVVAYAPNPPVAGASCTITYNAAGRSLAGANPVYIHLGWNNWAGTISPRPAMSGTTGGTWSHTFFVSSSWSEVDCVFTDNGSTWDNNGGNDWKIGTQNIVGKYPAAPGEQFMRYSYDIIPEPGIVLALGAVVFGLRARRR